MERDLPVFRPSLREVARLGDDRVFELVAPPAAE
jgi:hypothetical protein